MKRAAAIRPLDDDEAYCVAALVFLILLDGEGSGWQDNCVGAKPHEMRLPAGALADGRRAPSVSRRAHACERLVAAGVFTRHHGEAYFYDGHKKDDPPSPGAAWYSLWLPDDLGFIRADAPRVAALARVVLPLMSERGLLVLVGHAVSSAESLLNSLAYTRRCDREAEEPKA